MRFTGIPNFAPEILRRVRLDDPMKPKHLRKALEQLAEEGVTQVFKPLDRRATGSSASSAQLQLDVLQDAACRPNTASRLGFEAAPYEAARWLDADDRAELERFLRRQRASPRRGP